MDTLVDHPMGLPDRPRVEMVQPHQPETPWATVPSDTLLQGRKELHIWHQGQLYRLQATRQGKLILTK